MNTLEPITVMINPDRLPVLRQAVCLLGIQAKTIEEERNIRELRTLIAQLQDRAELDGLLPKYKSENEL